MRITSFALRRIVGFQITLLISVVSSLGQAPSPSGQATPSEAGQATCQRLADTSIATNTTIQAKVTGLDSAHLKQGKDVWFKVANGVIYPGCTLEADSVVYGRIMSVSSSKDPSSSELSLTFDHADCTGHDKQPLKLRLIAVIGPPDQTHRMHDQTPVQVKGGVRSIESAVAGTNALDMELNPGGPPNTVQAGIVVGVPKLKLEPTAGPSCSDKLTSTDSKIQLGPGSELLLALTETR